ncbi:FAD-dependent monooxygenase [Falsigemmobacter intermedius]|uniref:FAD-binding protein n=1 Tax=Falsigemmobacter intermedius TaxID=1553448 RepID=A0A444MBA2_9RHOB|nr:FAD-dependent monooxygenase [Falsigemmobacter intermedius]RWY40997.1 FAD-binding protein [Falsigemmobacter intermedius]
MTDFLADVIIVGGGPAGLTAALLLGQRGIPTVLFEASRDTGGHPRGHVVSTRSMEIFRELGLEAAIDAVSLPLERHGGVGFVTSLAGEEIGHIRTRGDAARDAAEIALSPCLKRSCPQDRLEPVLQEAARGLTSVDLRFGTKVTTIAQDDDGVTVGWEAADGTTGTSRARWLIGADGPRGPVREAAGIGMSGEVLGQQIGVYFHADLWDLVQDRPWLLWWIYNAQTTGVLISLDGRHRWTYNFPYPEGVDRSAFTEDRCREIVRAAIGLPDAPVDIRSIMPWRMQARLADQMHRGRIFIAGDAAHPLPPTGGQGMNTGIADVHNLVWKLDAVRQGRAGPELLESYTDERLPIARFNVSQSAANARKMAKAGLSGILALDPENSRIIDKPEGAALRAKMAAAIPAQRGHFDYPGQTFGIGYSSAVIVPDGTPEVELSVETFTPSARPGMRLPHLWVKRGGQRLSSLDLCRGKDLVLLLAAETADAEAAFRHSCAARGLDGEIYVEGRDGLRFEEAQWREIYGLGVGGALILRPDGHVAFRSPSADGTLAQAVAQILPL